MAIEILKYLDLIQREKLHLQKGMNFRAGGDYSIVLMSRRANAPYDDGIDEYGNIIYEGHDMPAIADLDPKIHDQPRFTRTGKLTENGKFFEAAIAHRDRGALPERVQVYEKIVNGVWADNGRYALVDAWTQWDGVRNVYKFKLVPLVSADDNEQTPAYEADLTRNIPSSVKAEVYKRDGGKCRICGATTDLHYDHILPYSKGGSSTTAENVQILCRRHNLMKRDNIE